MVVGIDEVGRGAWAGPLVVGAVLLGGKNISGLTDSKKLTAKQRLLLAKDIHENAVAIGLGWVSAENIDKHGLSKALKIASQLALKEITAEYTQIIIDGTVRFIDDPRVTTIKQADLLVPSVSAASIIAKVARDYYMSSVVAKEFPDYGFESHVGYGTMKHRQALEKHGVTKIHRQSFRPIQGLYGVLQKTEEIDKISKTQGRRAENHAALYLQKQGFKILAKNWRTKWCEIDIVARKYGTVFFVEVKHRENDFFGDGLQAITKKKLAQMKFAAELWRKQHNHTGLAQLSVIATSGNPPEVTTFLENV